MRGAAIVAEFSPAAVGGVGQETVPSAKADDVRRVPEKSSERRGRIVKVYGFLMPLPMPNLAREAIARRQNFKPAPGSR